MMPTLTLGKARGRQFLSASCVCSGYFCLLQYKAVLTFCRFHILIFSRCISFRWPLQQNTTTGWFKQLKFTVSQFLSMEVWNHFHYIDLKVSAAFWPWEGFRGNPLLACPSFCALACGLLLWSLSLGSRCSFFCSPCQVYLCILLQGYLWLHLEPTQIPQNNLSTQLFNLITHANTFFPNKISFYMSHGLVSGIFGISYPTYYVIFYFYWKNNIYFRRNSILFRLIRLKLLHSKQEEASVASTEQPKGKWWGKG